MQIYDDPSLHMPNDFDDHSMLVLAARYARKYSQDPGTQNGAVVTVPSVAVHDAAIKISMGFPVAAGANCFLHEDWQKRATDRDKKLTLIEHAERNAVFSAAFSGRSLANGTMYAVWAACPECARAIVAAGIKTLVTLQKTRDLTPDRWKAPIIEADAMLKEAGVVLRLYPGALKLPLRFDQVEIEL